ncbi:MAG TPA: LrgB family protein [Trichococcus sp.]|nr:LrgB family protein [Trichococcus sp.]
MLHGLLYIINPSYVSCSRIKPIRKVRFWVEIIFTGIFGTVVSILIFRIFKIEEPIAKGLALGAASHAMGTAESLKAGELQGAMSSLAMVVSGVMMVGFVPLAALFVQ